jgi:signal transduction histidine kinase
MVLLDGLTFQGGSRLSLYLTRIDMLTLAQEVAEQFEIQHGPRFKIIGASAEVLWSREEIKRALENLVGNAVKYGSAITPISIRLQSVDARLTMSVHNVGNPIAPSEIEDVFQVFARAQAAKDGHKEGWGIGLAFVREVAESHGGQLPGGQLAGAGDHLLYRHAGRCRSMPGRFRTRKSWAEYGAMAWAFYA